MAALKVVASLLFLSSTLLAADPVVSNVQGLQRPGTKLVDISYDVTADTPTVGVSLRISSDSGISFNVPATTLSGAVGANVPVGTGRLITWDAGADWPWNYSAAMRFEITADLPAPEGFVYVSAGSLPGSSWAGAQAVDAFFMAKTEVTWAEFQEVRTWASANGYDIGSVGEGGGPNRPVTNVSFYHALKWCNARSEKEGLTPAYKLGTTVYRTGDSLPTVDPEAKGYRLPSEKEWEFAARGGVKSSGYLYSGSNDVGTVAWYSQNSSSSTKDVATKMANELGISDMSGNISEWCFDASVNWIRRGGAWFNGQEWCSVSSRITPQTSSLTLSNFIGFRIANSINLAQGDIPNPNSGISEEHQLDTRFINPPLVSNVQGLQRPGSKLVDITYDVTADTPTVGVSLRISSDGGATFNTPATTLSGDVGANVRVGSGRVITWDAGADWLGNYSTAMRFEVTVDDGVVPAPLGFVYVSAGSLPGSSWAGAQAVDAFFMAKTEVTWAEFQEVRTWAAANGYDIGSVGAGGGANRPVTNVSWYHVVKWCNARSEKEGLTPAYRVESAVYRTGDSVPTVDPAANGYRLPSEKEWEFAARGGLSTKGYAYSGSNDVNAVAWYSSNSGGSTKDVATKKANELGISDMSGNLWEWCFDVHSGSSRVRRGGSWVLNQSGSLVTSRASGNPSSTIFDYGFRVARSSLP